MVTSNSNENIISSQYYPSNLEYYDYIYSDHIKYSKTLLTKLLPLLKNKNIHSVLDACCGSGNDVLQLYEQGFEINASDICGTMVSFTEHRFQNCFIPKSSFFISNVLKLSKTTPNKYDLVLFRGNTLGHLNSSEQIFAIEELIKVSVPNGLILIDFRNGVDYFANKKKYEQRGYGIDSKLNNIYFSFYRITYPSIISESYTIKSYLFVLNYKKIRFINYNKSIKANFVIKDSILAYLQSKQLKYEIITSEIGGLPYLESILIYNH
jgi:SAM-dependent methyltransferase